jgi:hypothetical protein
MINFIYYPTKIQLNTDIEEFGFLGVRHQNMSASKDLIIRKVKPFKMG